MFKSYSITNPQPRTFKACLDLFRNSFSRMRLSWNSASRNPFPGIRLPRIRFPESVSRNPFPEIRLTGIRFSRNPASRNPFPGIRFPESVSRNPFPGIRLSRNPARVVLPPALSPVFGPSSTPNSNTQSIHAWGRRQIICFVLMFDLI